MQIDWNFVDQVLAEAVSAKVLTRAASDCEVLTGAALDQVLARAVSN